MSNKHKHNYISTHMKIKKALLEMIEKNNRACIDVTRLASHLGIDQRTVKSHLKIMEVDEVGVFMDPGEKQFCTKEGVTLLANLLK
jgi:DNA-binding MarR family transcriptional regulator